MPRFLQLEALFRETRIFPIEVAVTRLLEPETQAGEIQRATAAANQALAEGRDTVLYTSRALVSAEGERDNLSIGRVVSRSLVAIVQGIQQRPRYLLAKGGITSSDVAVHGLGIRRALVLGQVLPGVPAWQCGPESRFPGMPYIVFPGNVGGPDALAVVVQRFNEER